MDTFVPNDTYIVGGDYTPSENEDSEEMDTDEDREAHSVVVCTGANACGKVCLAHWIRHRPFGCRQQH